MIRKAPLYQILSAIHVVFFTSLCCFGLLYLSGTLLLLPLLGAAFRVGKDVLYGQLDITSSVVKLYFFYLKEALHLERLFPVNLILLLNLLGMRAAARLQSLPCVLLCLVLAALLLVLALYIAGYDTFVEEHFSLAEAAVTMCVRPAWTILLLTAMILCIFYFSGTMALILLFSGTFFLFVGEVVIFISMLYHQKLTGRMDEEEKYAWLVSEEKRKKKRD